MIEQPTVMGMLWGSRKFRILVMDAIAGLIVLAVNQFLPASAEFLLSVWTLIQPIAVAVVVGIAVEDAAEKGAMRQ